MLVLSRNALCTDVQLHRVAGHEGLCLHTYVFPIMAPSFADVQNCIATYDSFCC